MQTTTQPRGNSNPTDADGYFDSSCTYGGEQKRLNLGDPLEICVFLSTIPPRKITYRIVVDEYTSLTMADSMKISVEEIQKE